MPAISLTDPTNGTTTDANVIASNNAALETLLNGQLDGSNLAATILGALVPAGAVMPFAGSVAPTGWLICDGASTGRAAQPALFAAIGTVYGAPDGTTFNLPDLRDKVPVGKSGTKTLGSTGGSETHTLTVAELPSHNHGGATGTANTSDQSNDHLHGFAGANRAVAINSTVVASGLGATVSQFPSDSVATTAGVNTGHVHLAGPLSIPSQGSGTPHSVMQPYAALNYIIKT